MHGIYMDDTTEDFQTHSFKCEFLSSGNISSGLQYNHLYHSGDSKPHGTFLGIIFTACGAALQSGLDLQQFACFLNSAL